MSATSHSNEKGTPMSTSSTRATKVAFITGGNRGVGLGTAIGLARKGVEVVIGCRSDAAGEEALAALRQKGLTATCLPFDVCNEDDHERARAYFEAHYGRLDILVNNAGIMLEGPRTPLDLPNTTVEVSGDALRRTFEVNFFSLVTLTQRLLPLIRRAPAGRIVNVSSILGSLHIHANSDDPRLPNHRQFAYNASKTAVNAFTIHLAKTLADTPIKVNAAHPGWVRTAMGGDNAELGIEEGAQTSVDLALLDDEGVTGAYRHREEALPW